MPKGIFQIISESYQLAGTNLFEYCSDAPILLKPFFYLYALFGIAVLYICSWVFYVLIIFDWFAGFINTIRGSLLGSIERRSENSAYSLAGFLFNPLIIGLLTPIFIFSAIIPKISAELDIDEDTGEVFKQMNISGGGTFQKIIYFSKETIAGLFEYLGNRSVFAWPVLIIPCLFNAGLMIVLIVCATPLLLLDILSAIVDSIRAFCIRTSRSLGNATEQSFGGFLFAPALLVVLVPVFLGLLIIPKFSTGIEVE